MMVVVLNPASNHSGKISSSRARIAEVMRRTRIAAEIENGATLFREAHGQGILIAIKEKMYAAITHISML